MKVYLGTRNGRLTLYKNPQPGTLDVIGDGGLVLTRKEFVTYLGGLAASEIEQPTALPGLYYLHLIGTWDWQFPLFVKETK